MFNSIKYTILIALLGATTTVLAQRDSSLTREVEVVKTFKPTISDANKIYEMPKIENEERQKPSFNYSIFSQPIFNTFSVNNLKAASFEGFPQNKPGYGLVKAGFGNYTKPYGEVFFNHLFAKKSVFGVHGMHLSSLGKLTLEGGDRVEAPFSKNQAEIYVKHLFRESILSVAADINHNGFTYYGYPAKAIPGFLLEENQDLSYQGSKQAYTKGGVNLNLKNLTANMDEQAFGLDFNYHHFGAKTSQKEHFAELVSDIRKPFSKGTGLLEAGVKYINQKSMTLPTNNQTWLYAKPAYYLGGKVAGIKIGFNAWFIMDEQNDAEAKVAPNVHFEFKPVKNIIKLFAGIDGNLNSNEYSKIAEENPFVNPEIRIQNNFEKYRFYGGLDGKFSSRTNFKFTAEYSMFDQQHFYYLDERIFASPTINPNPTYVENTFNVLYDKMDLLKFNAEIVHLSGKKMDMTLNGNYYVYKLDVEEHAWNLPDWDATLSVKYKISERLDVSTDVFLIGARKALIVEHSTHELSSEIDTPLYKKYNLDPAFDLNLRGNYKITQKLSAFAQLNNFGFQKYERWFGYPVQSFNFLAGASYSF